ncbi:hypothetical protein [Paenibacillus sp. OSY-SE]|uniref:hypothetical protein n=1 Tax=Paenibacillus sp. OSY-SE TaxID=1196323 RepID=UPI0002DD9F52|nr:hypothetical protein [Paenibacillus sp. OSY-SE]
MIRIQRFSVFWPILAMLLVAAADVALLLTFSSSTVPNLLSFGIALDFMVILPLLYFWFRVRRADSLKRAAFVRSLAAGLAGYAAMSLFVPPVGTELQQLLDALALGCGISLAAYVLYQLVRVQRSYRNSIAEGGAALDALRSAFADTVSSQKTGALLTHEASVFYHALFSWRKKPYAPERAAAFSGLEQSSMLVIVIGIIHVLVLEGAGFHFLIHQWSALAAWILTLSNVYFILALIADYRLMKLNPVLVTDRDVRIRFAHDIWADVEREDINSVWMTKEPLPKELVRDTAVPVFGTPNVILQFHRPVTVTSRFGMKRQMKQIALCLDKPHDFVTAVMGDRE